MPRIDPLQLLNCLNVLLAPSGGIKSDREVNRISSLMEKFSKKLVSKCVYLLILKASDVQLLSMFMASGGWNLIYNWMVHAVEAKNYPFLAELLEVIIICPVDIERLKSNPMPRAIKQLSKDVTVDTRVKELASDIVKQWLAIVKGTPSAAAPATAQTSEATHSSQAEGQEEIVEVQSSDGDVRRDSLNDSRAISDASIEEEDEVDEEMERPDGNYVKSTSPSSSSMESDDSDVFVPYRKSSLSSSSQSKKKSKLKSSSSKKAEKYLKSVSPPEGGKVKLKSKLINSDGAEEEKDSSRKTPIKLKIEKRKDSITVEPLKSKKDKSEEKGAEEKSKEKRKSKEEKEKEKFAKFKQEREKKESSFKDKKDKRGGDKSSSSKEKSPQEQSKPSKEGADISKFIPRPIDKLGRIPKLTKDSESGKSSQGQSSSSDDGKRKEESKTSKMDEKKAKKEEISTTKSVIQKLKEDKEKEQQRKDLKRPVPPPQIPAKKPVSMSVEKRFTAGEAKPKTVKAYNSKFRLTGLEQEVSPKPPTSRKSSVTNSSTSTPGASSPAAVKRSPTRDLEIEPAEKKLKSPDINIEEKSSPVPNKVKKPFLQESDFFMNAMNIALETQKEQLRKRKKPGGAKSENEASSPTVKAESKEAKPAFKFYKDTLESTNDESINESASESPDTKNLVIAVEKEVAEVIADENKPPTEKSVQGLKSSLALYRTRKGPKKSVKWKSDEDLEAVQFFEVDVSERTNVVRDFWAMQMMERNAERESMLMARKTDNDKMVAKTGWRQLVPIDIPPPTTVRGVNSQEKNIQYARERRIPPSLFYDKSMIPDTPAEPDLEIHPSTVPPVIPLDDISGSQDSINDFSSFKWPEPKQFPPDPSDFNAMNAAGAPNFMLGAGVPPPIFPFPDGTFPPPYSQPLFPGGPVVPGPVPPANWSSGSGDQQQQQGQQPPWIRPPFDGVPPQNLVPPPGMMGPPPFGMIPPPFPIPGAPFPGAPNMFPPPPAMNTPMNNGNNSDNNGSNNNNSNNNGNNDGSNSGSGSGSGGGNNYSGGSDGNKRWNNEDRFHRKDNWKNNYSSDRGGRDKRGSNNWRGSGGNSRLCRVFQKKGYCNVSGCRFYHPEN